MRQDEMTNKQAALFVETLRAMAVEIESDKKLLAESNPELKGMDLFVALIVRQIAAVRAGFYR